MLQLPRNRAKPSRRAVLLAMRLERPYNGTLERPSHNVKPGLPPRERRNQTERE